MEEPKKHRKEVKRWLEVDYTPEEISDMSMELARKNTEHQKAEDQKKSANSQFKSEIDKLTAEINDLSSNMLTGSEVKEVKCEIEDDYVLNKKSITRLDTKEVIFYGDIPEDEKQMEMDLDSELEKDKKAHEELVGHEIDEKEPAEEQTSGAEPDTTDEEQPPSEAPQTDESQDKLDAEDEKIKEDLKKDSPLIYEASVGPKAQK